MYDEHEPKHAPHAKHGSDAKHGHEARHGSDTKHEADAKHPGNGQGPDPHVKMQLDPGEFTLSYTTGAKDRYGNLIWVVFADITVTTETEYWTVATDLLEGLKNAQALQMVSGLQTLSSRSTVNQTCRAPATWAAQSSPAYSTGATDITFAGTNNFTYGPNRTDVGALCLTFQLRAHTGGGFELSQVIWYNPTNVNVSLRYCPSTTVSWGGPGTASRYSGDCYTASSAF